MFGFGVLLTTLIAWFLPLAAMIWVLVTLHRVRTGQQEILDRITSLERRLGERA